MLEKSSTSFFSESALLLIIGENFLSVARRLLRRKRPPGEDYLAACYVTVQIIVRQAAFGAVQAEILDCAMQRVGRQRPVDAFAFELLRAHLGAQVDRDTSAAAMLIERTGAQVDVVSAIVSRRR